MTTTTTSPVTRSKAAPPSFGLLVSSKSKKAGGPAAGSKSRLSLQADDSDDQVVTAAPRAVKPLPRAVAPLPNPLTRLAEVDIERVLLLAKALIAGQAVNYELFQRETDDPHGVTSGVGTMKTLMEQLNLRTPIFNSIFEARLTGLIIQTDSVKGFNQAIYDIMVATLDVHDPSFLDTSKLPGLLKI